MGQLTQTTEQIQAGIDVAYAGDESLIVGWDDLTAPLISTAQKGGAKVVYNFANNSVTLSPEGVLGTDTDTICVTLQKPHSMAEDGEFRLHIHWEQDYDGEMSPTFAVRYRVQLNGQEKTTSWTTITPVISAPANEAFDRPTETGVLNQITKLCTISLSAAYLSSNVEIQLARTDASSYDIEAVFVDVHYPTDQPRGSRQEYVK